MVKSCHERIDIQWTEAHNPIFAWTLSWHQGRLFARKWNRNRTWIHSRLCWCMIKGTNITFALITHKIWSRIIQVLYLAIPCFMFNPRFPCQSTFSCMKSYFEGRSEWSQLKSTFKLVTPPIRPPRFEDRWITILKLCLLVLSWHAWKLYTLDWLKCTTFAEPFVLRTCLSYID